MAKVNFMASDSGVPVKPDVRAVKGRPQHRALLSYKLADDKGTVIGMEASDLFQLVWVYRFQCNCVILNV